MTEPTPPNWERAVLEKLALKGLEENRRSRQWSTLIKLLWLLFAFLVLSSWFGWVGPSDTDRMTTGKHTALVDLKGVIGVEAKASADKMNAALNAAFKDKNTQAVVLRINSPGGSPVQAGYINDEIKRLRAKYPAIPLYAVVQDLCASGGYYVAVAADKIYVDKASLVGSIGVIMGGFGFTGAMEKLGVERRTYTAGTNKDFLDPFAPENPAHKEHAKKMLAEIHEQFVKVVRQGRGKRLQESPEIFSGLIWTGERSVELGLADAMGSLEYVAREVVKTERVVDFTPDDNYFETLSKRLGSTFGETFGRALLDSASGDGNPMAVGKGAGGAKDAPPVDFELVREAFDKTAVGLTLVNMEGVFQYVNRTFCEITGYTKEELVGKSFRVFTHPDDVGRDVEHLNALGEGRGVPQAVDKRYIRKDGSEVWVRRSVAVLGKPARFIIGSFMDLTEQHAKDREHAEQLHFTRALLDAIPSPVYFKDREGRYQVYNRAWDELFGGGRSWIGQTVHDMFDGEQARQHHERDRLLFERPASTSYEALVPDSRGAPHEMLYNKVSFVDRTGEVAGLIGVITDVTPYKEAERALEASEARFRVLTESALDLISVLAEDGSIHYQSPALRHLMGYDPAETVGLNIFDMIHRDDVDHVRAAVRRIVESDQSREPIEFRIRHRDGMWRTFESLGTNCLDNRHIGGLVFNSRDITDRKVIQQRIQHLAYHDNLTGLPNRSLLQDRLAHSIARAERGNRKVAVLFIDLDNFKNINDTLGHDVGDELLRQVSRRLSECVRLEDTIARQGGDEFIVLLDSLDDGRGASIVAQKILNALRLPFLLGGTEQHVSGSVGIALFPEDGRDAQTLMKNADTAMFHGKGLGKNTYQYFTAQMNIAVKRRMTLESALRRAVMQKDFLLHYQPQINLETGEIIAVEALVRWKTEDSGTVMPGDFIPLAEETGLINEIGEWVLREGCRQAKEWQDQGLAPRRMAINLSARQFSDKAFLDMVTRVLADTGLDPQWLELEITETQVMRQTEGMIMLLNRLSEMGIHLAIDDFGTGYSSLSYLKRLPIQKLKIDQSFIRDITVDPNDTAIVVAIINMAKSLDLDTIAEGVETAGQLALLRSKGCRVGQGFYFSAPVRADQLYPLLKQNNLYLQSQAR